MKMFTGEVISTKMDKTATVLVERVVKHPVYKKRYTRSKKYHVHDPFGVEVGQTVEFVPSKPYSKLKRWVVTKTFDTDGNVINESKLAKDSDSQSKKTKKKGSKAKKSKKKGKKK